VQYGKPTTAAYKFAEKVLKDRMEEIAGIPLEKAPNVYMIGGNG
jgi:ribonucleotide monophosphatase NagD (HAD superfamily)